MSGVSRVTLGIGVAAAIVLGVAMAYYHLARPGADLPLQLPKGAVLTKARDTVAELRLFGTGIAHERLVHRRHRRRSSITAMAGLPAARDAIREGTPVAYWRAGITHTADPSGELEPPPAIIPFASIPKGELVAFATGYATDGALRTPIARRRRRSASRRSRKPSAIDASGYELEVVERSFPAGKTELTWRSPATKYGHVEQMQVNLQGERLILIERSLQRPRGYKAPETPIAMRIFQGAGPAILAAVVVIGWGFGLYYLFKMKNWDALTRPLPLALCALVVLQVGLSTIGSSGVFQSLLGVVAVSRPADRHGAAGAERRAVVDRPPQPRARCGRRSN